MKSIKLKNFQSHEDNKLDLFPGLNVILGDSRQGKTAIKRGFIWARYDRPIGKTNISFWDRDKKGMPKTEQSVEIVLDDGKSIKRTRTKDRNGYDVIIDGKLYEENALNKQIPDKIIDLFNMDDINIQGQFDGPFMLSSGNSEIGRIINKAVNLEKIDDVLSSIESKRKKNNAEIKTTKEQLVEIEKNIDDLQWIDYAEKVFQSIKELDGGIEKLETKKNKINSYSDQITKIIFKLSEIPGNMENIESKISSISLLNERILKSHRASVELITKIDRLKEIESKINGLLDKNTLDKSSKICKKIFELSERISEKDDLLNKIGSFIKQYKTAENEIEAHSFMIEELLKQTPDICPYCGAKL